MIFIPQIPDLSQSIQPHEYKSAGKNNKDRRSIQLCSGNSEQRNPSEITLPSSGRAQNHDNISNIIIASLLIVPSVYHFIDSGVI